MLASIASAVMAVALTGTLATAAPAATELRAKVCKDKTAITLKKAGFKGHKNRMAWSIVMRESKGQNLDESSPWYTGALGIWQIQTSAHAGNSWWSRSAMLNPQRQSRIVYRYMTKRGTYWRPWGLTPQGTLDATHYGGWSSWQHENWIMAPFRRYYAAWPKECA
jgi:hypothetical protein